MKENYKKPFLYAALVHVVVFILLALSFDFTPASIKQSARPSEPIQAVTVDQTKVQAEVDKIKSKEAAKKKAELKRARHLKALAKRAKAEQRKAALRLKHMKEQQKKLKREQLQQQKEAQKKLIAIKQKQEEAQKHLDSLQKKRKEEAVKKHQALAKKSQEEKLLEQQLASEQQKLSDAQNQQMMSEIGRYKALILNAIGQKWIMPAHLDKTLSTKLLIALDADGKVLKVSMLKSSGDAVLDRSVISAIWKASPLPMPVDPALLEKFKALRLTVHPEGLLGH